MSENFLKRYNNLDKESDESARAFLLKTILSSRDSADRATAAISFTGETRPNEAEVWRAALKDSNAAVRTVAAKKLSELGSD